MTKECNIFKEMVISVCNTENYKQFLNNKKSKVFSFGVVLMLCYFIITIGVPFARFQIATGGIRVIAEDYIPDFEIKQGTLWMEQRLKYDDDDIFLFVDTTPDVFFGSATEMAPFLRAYSSAIIADSEKLIVNSNGTIREIHFNDFSGTISKATVLGYLPYLYLIIAVIMILMYVLMTAFFFFGVLLVALIGMIAASFMKYPISFGQIYLLGVYTRTLPLLIKAMMSFLPFKVPYLGIINFGISICYIIVVIQKLKVQQETKPLEIQAEIDNLI